MQVIASGLVDVIPVRLCVAQLNLLGSFGPLH